MRTLYLLRHAKSSWSDATLDDHDRPLNERGLHDAPLMVRHFLARKEVVDLIVSSTAHRALATARIFHRALSLPDRSLVQERRVYLASPSVLLSVVNAFPDTSANAMLVGHNPGISDFVEMLTDNSLGDLPTAALVRIDLPFTEWAMVSRGSGTLVRHDHPKLHSGHFGSL